MCTVLSEVALGSSQGQLPTRLRFCSEFYFQTFITHKYVAYIAVKRTLLLKSVYKYYTKRYQRPLSPPEREYETVLECAYSKILESRFFVTGTCILDSNRLRDSGLLVLYSGFHQHKFPGFWNLDSLDGEHFGNMKTRLFHSGKN